MTPNVLMPDVVLWATGHLRSVLTSRPEPYTSNVYVGDKMPTTADNKPTRKDRMVIVRRDGGRRLDGARETSTLGIQVWAKSDQEANDLSRLVRALLWAAPNGAPVVRVDDSTGPITIPDESGQPCRYLVVEVVVRGTPLT